MFDVSAIKVIHNTEDESVYLENTGDAIANLRSLGKHTQDKINEYDQKLKANRKERLKLEKMAKLDDEPKEEEETPLIDLTSNFDDVIEKEKRLSEERERRRKEMFARFEEKQKPVISDISIKEDLEDVKPKEPKEETRELKRETERELKREPERESVEEEIPARRPVRHRMEKKPNEDMEMMTLGLSEEELKEIEKNEPSEDLTIIDGEEKIEKEIENDTFLEELKKRTENLEKDVEKVERLEESKKPDTETKKVDAISEELKMRNPDAEKEKEIAEILKKRKADLDRYAKERAEKEKSAGFTKQKKPMTSFQKWLIAIGVVLLLAVFLGLRANGYVFDTYGVNEVTVNVLTGESTEVKVSGIGALFSSFTVESVTMFAPVFNAKVFFEAFILVAGIGGVVLFLVWSANDTKKKNRDGKEHGNSRIATRADIRSYQKHFMD